MLCVVSKSGKKTTRPFNEVLVYYGIERFLYRLGRSEFEKKFILKGALMIQVWSQEMARATHDVDFLGRLMIIWIDVNRPTYFCT